MRAPAWIVFTTEHVSGPWTSSSQCGTPAEGRAHLVSSKWLSRAPGSQPSPRLFESVALDHGGNIVLS